MATLFRFEELDPSVGPSPARSLVGLHDFVDAVFVVAVHDREERCAHLAGPLGLDDPVDRLPVVEEPDVGVVATMAQPTPGATTGSDVLCR
jgi:hypothetical protein